MSKEEVVKNATRTVTSSLKKSLYDWLSAAILLAIVVASLDIFDLRKFNWSTIKSLTAEWLPYFFATILLDNNLYNKGKFIGKSTKNFIDVMTSYSTKVVDLTGEQITALPYFCSYYNDKVLREKQIAILKKEGIPYHWFDDEHDVTRNGESVHREPLKTWTEASLSEEFNETQVAAIKKAKNVNIVGLRVNLLLGSYDRDDDTDLGPTEEQTTKKRRITSTVSYAATTVIMTIIGIKNFYDWGWTGLVIVLFKTVYTFVKSYMSYFKGYNDITINLSNHIARKDDILKEFLHWYEVNYIVNGNISKNI